MRRFLIYAIAAVCSIAAGAQGVIHDNGDPRIKIPMPNCGRSPFYIDDSTQQLYIATSGSPCVWAPPGSSTTSLPGITSQGPGVAVGNAFASPAYTPTAYIHYGDSLSACSNGLTFPANCFVNRFGGVLNVSPTNRATSGDQAADVPWRMQSSDSPAIAAEPNLDTMTIGTNDADQNGVGASTWEANFKLFHTAALIWLGLPSGKTAGSTAATTGTCANDTTFAFVTGEQCTANASTLTFSAYSTAGNPIYILYRSISSDAGTWTYSVDGGAPVAAVTAPPINFTTVNGHTSSMGYIRIAGLAAGTHSIVCTQTHSGTMSILAIASLQSLKFSALPHMIVMDVPNQKDQLKLAATTAYSADASADVTLLANDGFNIVLAPVSASLQATTAAADMFDTLHPNDIGHLEMYQSLLFASDVYPAFPPPIAFSQGATPTVTITAATVTQTISNGSATHVTTSTFNSPSGNATDQQTVVSSSASAGTEQIFNGTAYWYEGFLPGAGTGQDYDIYDFRASRAVMRLPTNVMPASSYGGNAAGPVLLVVQTPAARKGTFICTAGGTITISNANEAATSDVVISLNAAGGTISTPPAMKTVTAATGFTVLCGASDTSTYNYNILN